MLKTDIQDSVADVILDRPEIHNALNEELIAQLTRTFKELGSRPDVRAIVLQNGKSFSAGAD
jgi:methylglutaconyl-CoA hydratase